MSNDLVNEINSLTDFLLSFNLFIESNPLMYPIKALKIGSSEWSNNAIKSSTDAVL